MRDAQQRASSGLATATAFYDAYREQLQTFEHSHEVAPGVAVRITGGHTPGHSVVDLVSGDERLTFAGDAMFPVGFDHPEWQNGFDHDPEEPTRVRIGLYEELAENRGLPVAAHLPFPSLGAHCAQWRCVSLGACDLGFLSA